METRISLSLLEYEDELSKQGSPQVFSNITELVNSGKLYSLHLDVMRPPLIPNRSAFSIDLLKRIYEEFHERISLEIHLMVEKPGLLIEEINKFIEPWERNRITMIIQAEAYSSEEDTVKSLRTIKGLRYKAGVGVNLPTPFERLTKRMIENTDLVLIMSVPMGRGGQEYSKEATGRIRSISSIFPRKPIKVDGGINDITFQYATEAGAQILVLGSFITGSRNPLDTLERFHKLLRNSQKDPRRNP